MLILKNTNIYDELQIEFVECKSFCHSFCKLNWLTSGVCIHNLKMIYCSIPEILFKFWLVISGQILTYCLSFN